MYLQTSGTMRTAHKTTHYIYIYIYIYVCVCVCVCVYIYIYMYGSVIINKTGILWFVTTAMSGHTLPLQACKAVKIQQVWSTWIESLFTTTHCKFCNKFTVYIYISFIFLQYGQLMDKMYRIEQNKCHLCSIDPIWYNSQNCRRGHIINTMECKYHYIIPLTIDM